MTFYIHVISGLNNKLIPLLSLLRIAKKEKKNIKCLWGKDAYINKSLFSFKDLFEDIDEILFINEQEYTSVFNDPHNKIYNRDGSDRNRKEIIYKTDNKQQIIVFHKIVHMISYPDDNVVGTFVPYPREMKNSNKLVEELRETVKFLKPTEKIQTKIASTLKKIKGRNVIGLHLRTTDGGFQDIPKNKVFEFISKNLNINNSMIYISVDNQKLENEIKNTFGNKVITFENPFGNNYSDKFNRTSWGTMNAVCEMFILSKCNFFYGTPGSSFSFMVWLLRNDDTLKFWCDNPW